MTFEIGILLFLLVGAMVVFSMEWLPIDVVAISLVVALVLLGILTPAEAFAGFASDVILVLCAIFILSGTLVRTGVMEAVGRWLHRLAGNSERRVVAAVMTLSAAMSSFLSNTNSTAVLTPAVIEFSRHSQLSPSRFLIPLAYASMLGGASTLIGTSANLAASGFMERAGLEPLGLFELLPVGAAMSLVGIAYTVLFGYRLLPKTAKPSLSEEYDLGRYLSEVVLDADCELLGRDLIALDLADRGVYVLAVRRAGTRILPRRAGVLRVGDVMVIEADRQALLDLEAMPGLDFQRPMPLVDEDLEGDAVELVEAIVMPGSLFLGRTLRDIGLRSRYGASVLAIHRRGVPYAIGLRDLRLAVGDIMLVRGGAEQLGLLEATGDLRLIGEVAHEPAARRKGLIVLGALLAAVLAGSTGIMPLSISFLLAVLVIVLSRCVAVDEMYAMIDWRVIVLIGGMTSFRVALQKTGAADWLARLLADAVLPFGTYAVMAAFIALTMVLTQPLSNAAAALVVLPVALSVAARIGVDPRALAILVTLAASLSFIAPFEPACLLVYSPGRYRFRDFIVAGVPLSLLAVGVLLLLVPVFWPLG